MFNQILVKIGQVLLKYKFYRPSENHIHRRQHRSPIRQTDDKRKEIDPQLYDDLRSFRPKEQYPEVSNMNLQNTLY